MCAVTDSPELFCATVSRPSHAWNPTRNTAAILGHRIDRRSRWSLHAKNATPRIRKPMTAATVRWIHSIQAAGSSVGGITCPWHSGQSGQPMPESVTRTITPIVTSRIVAMTVARAVFWKRVTATGWDLGDRARDGPGVQREPILRTTPKRRTGAFSASRGDSRYAPSMLRSPARPFTLFVVLVAIAAAACSPSPTPAPSVAAQPSVLPLILGQQVKGPFRFVFSFIDAATN